MTPQSRYATGMILKAASSLPSFRRRFVLFEEPEDAPMGVEAAARDDYADGA